jgi:hypothetical protein
MRILHHALNAQRLAWAHSPSLLAAKEYENAIIYSDYSFYEKSARKWHSG